MADLRKMSKELQKLERDRLERMGYDLYNQFMRTQREFKEMERAGEAEYLDELERNLQERASEALHHARTALMHAAALLDEAANVPTR